MNTIRRAVCSVLLIATPCLMAVPAHASAESVDILLGGSIKAAAAIPLSGCTSRADYQNYGLTLNGVQFSFTVGWTEGFDCSHWATSLSVSSGTGGYVLNVRGASVDAQLGYQAAGGGVFIDANSLATGCHSAASGFSTTFSGANVPAGKVAEVIVGVGTGSCAATATNVALQDGVN